MKRVLRNLGWGATAVALVIVVTLGYATARGRLMWFRSLHGVVITENGRAVDGSLHHSRVADAFILTIRLHNRAESYWIAEPGVKEGRVSSCGEWSAPAFPLFFISTFKPPCFLPIEGGLNRTAYGGFKDRQLVVGRSNLRFIEDDGELLQTSWQ